MTASFHGHLVKPFAGGPMKLRHFRTAFVTLGLLGGASDLVAQSHDVIFDEDGRRELTAPSISRANQSRS
jgi:hypothetical protein